MDDKIRSELVDRARAASTHAYAPYSKYRVGAVVLCRSGKIFSGCNVENASYGATVCAERIAVFSMVAAGERELEAVAVYAAGSDLPHPCGVCRQVIWEFGQDVDVVAANDQGQKQSTIAALLPQAFRLTR